MQKLNRKERAVLDYLAQEIDARGYAPSVRDICVALGYASTSTVQAYLDRLEKYGYLRREVGKSRSIVLCESRTPHRIALAQSSGERGFLPDFLYCGDLLEGEAPHAVWDEERGEYRIYVGERLIARLKPEKANQPSNE